MSMMTPNTYTSLNSKFFPSSLTGTISVPPSSSNFTFELYFFPGKESVFLGKIILSADPAVNIDRVKLFYEIPPSAWGPSNRVAETDLLPVMDQIGSEFQITFDKFGTGGNIEAAASGMIVEASSATGGNISYKVLTFVPLLYYVS